MSTIATSQPWRMQSASPSRATATGSFEVGPVHRHVDLLAELLQLVDRGGALEVGGDEERLPSLLAQVERELRRGGRLPRPLETRHQHDRRRARRERDPGGARPHQFRELVVDDLHDLLRGRNRLRDLLALGALLDVRDEVLDDLEVHVRLEQGEADLAHRLGDRLLVEAALLAEVAEDALEPV